MSVARATIIPCLASGPSRDGTFRSSLFVTHHVAASAHPRGLKGGEVGASQINPPRANVRLPPAPFAPHVPSTDRIVIIMRKVAGGHLLCFVLLASPLCWAEDTQRDKRSENSTVCSQVKTRGLFARKKIAAPQKSHTNKSQSSLMPPARRCGRLMGSCSTHVRCCDPCASCRCRLFNTICHCWRMNPLCLQKT
uniref:Agouti domain-containing protein n=1 Tax=Gasterosteus aculeatus aculeatus TaxID=481459 RepID=A0AAQ4P421_GASAC|nr:agouti-signaling protein 2b [Gasterosteus aculeatus aculeatus]